MLPPVTTAVADGADVVAVVAAEAAEASMTEDVEVAGVADVVALAVVEVRVVAVEIAPTVGALETSKARSRLFLKSAIAMP